MSYNISVTDLSPTFIYSPTREGSLSSSWVSSFSGSPDGSYDSTHTGSNTGMGVSSHSTESVGATLQIDFSGTAAFLYGSGTAGAYNTGIDSDQAIAGVPSGNLLASYTDLSNGKHTLLLTVTQARPLNISSATLTVELADNSSIVNTTQNAIDVAANGTTSMDPFFTTSGNGPFNTDHGTSEGYQRLDTTGAGSSMSFSCSNTSVLFVYGSVNYDHQTYSVNLSPPAGASQGVRVFNATSKWFAFNSLIYWEVLDRNTTYSVSLKNLVSGKYLDIHQVVMMDAIPTPSSSNGPSHSATASQSSPPAPTSSSAHSTTIPSTRAIVGIAVGAAVLLALVLLFACFWCKRRSTRQGARTSNSFNMGSHPLKNPHLTPFYLAVPNSAQQDGSFPSNYSDQYPSDTFDPYGNAHVTPHITTGNTERGRWSAFVGTHSQATSSSFFPKSPDRYSMPGSAAVPSPTGATRRQDTSRTEHENASPAESSPLRATKSALPVNTPRTASMIRQETDAGPVSEEALPPGYDPKWATLRQG